MHDAYLADRKRALRARMRAVTRAIGGDPPRRRRRSAAVCAALAELVTASDGGAPARVMVFESRPDEVDLASFVAWCRERAIDVYVPVVAGERLDPVALGDAAGGTPVGPTLLDPALLDPALLDVVIVPGLAFTADGRRLGRGGGHYDRFLSRLGAGCLRVGVAYREQLVDSLPSAPHDAAVDTVVTA